MKRTRVWAMIAAGAAAARLEDGRGPMRIVLVDDHPHVRDGTAALLKALGHTVVGEASDGDEGVRVVRATRPQLVLMDLHMPVMDGIEATRILKAECRP